MKLKEIEVGMVIHCKTQDQAWDLVKHSNLPPHFASRLWNIYECETCYCHDGFPDRWSYSDKDYFIKEHFDIIEFEDLIIDEPELTLPTKPVLKDFHITCELMSGEILDFGGTCNGINCCDQNENLVVFITDNKKLDYGLILSMIPINNIKRINYVNSREQINKVLKDINEEE